MFTRFKTLAGFLIFCVSFSLTVLFLGENGILYRRALLQEQKTVQMALKEKEAEVQLLRDKESKESVSLGGGKDLVYSFTESSLNIYAPMTKDEQIPPVPYRGLDMTRCVLVALIPTLLYCLVVIAWWLIAGGGKPQEMEEEKKEERRDIYDD